MGKFLFLKKYIVMSLTSETFKPFEKTRGPISFDRITMDNVEDASPRFGHAKASVFKEKLNNRCVGVFARHDNNVVGYMWRKDFKTINTVKADGYVPLAGHFSHLHFARVAKEMRGRALQLIMFSWLMKDAFERGIPRIYTDFEHDNHIAMRGAKKIGFSECFSIFTLRSSLGYSISFKKMSKIESNDL